MRYRTEKGVLRADFAGQGVVVAHRWVVSEEEATDFISIGSLLAVRHAKGHYALCRDGERFLYDAFARHPVTSSHQKAQEGQSDECNVAKIIVLTVVGVLAIVILILVGKAA